MTTQEKRERHTRQAAAWRALNPKKIRKSQRKYRRLHPRAIKESRRRWNAKLKAQVFAAYGGKCACCGELEQAFFVIDHIAGGGNAHRRSLTGNGAGTNLYVWLKRRGFPRGFQLLCANCNMAKTYQGVCPHHAN